MDLNYSAEDQAFRQEVREWLRANLPPRTPETPADQRAWHRKLYDAGFVAMNWPKAYGGWERRPMEQAIVGEEMARHNAPPPINYMGINVCGLAILHHGTEEQKQRYLKPLLMADDLWCQLYSEPNAGSDLASLQCRADVDGDTFRVNGQKIWTSAATSADYGLLLARTDREAPKHHGISCLIVDMHAPGVDVRPLTQISGSQEFSEVFFSDVVVPADNLVGEMNAGWMVGQTPLAYERGGDMLPIVTRLQQQFDRLIQASSVARRDGRRGIDAPLTRQRLAELYTRIEVLRYAALRNLSRMEKGQMPGPDASILKLHYTECDKYVQELMLDVLGPYGQQLEGAPPEFQLDLMGEEALSGTWAYYFVWARAGTIYAGSSEIQKNIIGERVLGLPKEIRADRVLAQQKAAAG
jgi:alkylation response protein AidB-like acyl-CoA dehydrogenase